MHFGGKKLILTEPDIFYLAILARYGRKIGKIFLIFSKRAKIERQTRFRRESKLVYGTHSRENNACLRFEFLKMEIWTCRKKSVTRVNFVS